MIPNRMGRKLLDVSKAAKLGWSYTTELEEGILLAYEDFRTNWAALEKMPQRAAMGKPQVPQRTSLEKMPHGRPGAGQML